jgi:hypothetical protein
MKLVMTCSVALLCAAAACNPFGGGGKPSVLHRLTKARPVERRHGQALVVEVGRFDVPVPKGWRDVTSESAYRTYINPRCQESIVVGGDLAAEPLDEARQAQLLQELGSIAISSRNIIGKFTPVTLDGTKFTRRPWGTIAVVTARGSSRLGRHWLAVSADGAATVQVDGETGEGCDIETEMETIFAGITRRDGDPAPGK